MVEPAATTQAVILASGRGQRMRGFEGVAHKALLEVAGETLLARMGRQLAAIGITDLLITTGHARGEIERAGRALPLETRFVHNEAYAHTGNIVSLSCAMPSVRGSFLLLECDLCLADEALASMTALDSLLVSPQLAGERGSMVALEATRVTGLLEAAVHSHFKTVNVSLLSRRAGELLAREMTAMIARDNAAFYERALSTLLERDAIEMSAVVIARSQWVECDAPADLEAARAIFDVSCRHDRRLRARLERTTIA